MIKRLELASEQESALEFLMQNTFGGGFVCIPHEYTKGKAKREPADLAWFARNTAVLFHLKDRNKSAEIQTKGNVRQADGYLRMWKKGGDHFSLKGTNRFGETISLPYHQVNNLVLVSVVSARCGISLSKPIDPNSNELWINVPDDYIKWIAESGGSIVDLVWGALLWIKSDPQGSFEQLEVFTKSYCEACFEKLGPDYTNNSVRSEAVEKARVFLWGLRKPGHLLDVPVFEPSRLKANAEIFSDMTLVQTMILADQMAKISQLPADQVVAVDIKNLHYRFLLVKIQIETLVQRPDIIEFTRQQSEPDAQPCPAILAFVMPNPITGEIEPLGIGVPQEGLPASQLALIMREFKDNYRANPKEAWPQSRYFA